MSTEDPDYYPRNLLRFVRQISERHPVLKSVYDEHFRYWDETFPTMYLSDVVPAFVPLYFDPQTRGAAMAILQVMEEAMGHDDLAVANEAAVGLVEMLPYGDDPGTQEICAALPPRIRASWDRTYGQVGSQ